MKFFLESLVHKAPAELFKLRLDCTIRDAIEGIQRSGAFGCVLLYREDKFLNIVTDGDIRRSIIEGFGINESAENILIVKNKGSRPTPIVADVGSSEGYINQLSIKHSLRQLILVNSDGQPISVVHFLHPSAVGGLAPVEFSALLMAGGFGTRLLPLTNNTPKPMLPIQGRPLLEILVEKLISYGASNIFISTHYLAEHIVSHFQDGQKFGVPISYIHETKPLGTGGAFSFLPRQHRNILVMNADILTDLDFSLFHAQHMRSGAIMSIATAQYGFQVPYGVILQKEGQVMGVEEKPKYNFSINSGIYFLSPSVQDYIPVAGTEFTMPELAQILIEKDCKVGQFPIFERWIDIGRPDDYYGVA